MKTLEKIAAAGAVVWFGFFVWVHLVGRGPPPPRGGGAPGSPRLDLPGPQQGGAAAGSANALSLIVEPRDGLAPVLGLIQAAQHSIDLVMYECEDRTIETALSAAAERGVAVRVLLNYDYYGGRGPPGSKPVVATPRKRLHNEAAFAFFAAHNIPVAWTPSYFALTHQKSMVIDGALALIMTFNFTPQYYANDRDFGILDRDPKDVAAIEEAFADDWNNVETPAPTGDSLVWSPGSKDATLALIANAEHSLAVYNEEMADPEVTAALADASKRGVAVAVIMTYSPEWKAAFKELVTAGVSVRTYPATNGSLYIHAKMIIADGKAAFVGSENFSTGSLTENRELGIITENQPVIAGLQAVFASDWRDADVFAVSPSNLRARQEPAPPH